MNSDQSAKRGWDKSTLVREKSELHFEVLRLEFKLVRIFVFRGSFIPR